jgi:hypothetical protein
MSSSSSGNRDAKDIFSSIEIFKNNWVFLLSLILFGVSALWSGWGMFIQFHESNLILAVILIFGMFVIGFSLSAILSIFIEIQRKTRIDGKIFISISVFLCTMWLFISPMYNSMTLCARYAVQAEVEEKYKTMYQMTSLYRDRDDLFSMKIIPQLHKLHQKILKHKNAQAEQELGGCGPICTKLSSIYGKMKPLLTELSDKYSEDDLDSKKILKKLNDLSSTISDPSESIFDILRKLNDTRTSVIHNMKRILLKESPIVLIKDCNKQIVDLYSYLEERVNNSAQYTDITIKAATEAKKAMERPKKDVAKLINDVEEINKKIDASAIKKDIGVEVLPVRLHILLILEHAKEYFNLIALAFFIDILAIILVLFQNWFFYTQDKYEMMKRIFILKKVSSGQLLTEKEKVTIQRIANLKKKYWMLKSDINEEEYKKFEEHP